MASTKQIRAALINLMSEKDANKANPGGTVYAPDQVTNPGAVTGFRDTNLRDARQQAREVQGEDPLAESWQTPNEDTGRLSNAQVELGERRLRIANRDWDDPEYMRDESLSGLSRVREKDPSRLPDAEVPGSNEGITSFESMMDMMAGGTMNDLPSSEQMGRLRQIAPDLYEIVKKEYDNIILNEEIPF